MASDRVAAAVAELYGADPDAFTERRKALATAAREAGQRDAATAITALRKPTRAAWVVNRLAQADPDAPGRLAAMAAELRDAERAKDGPRLRELSAARGALIDALTAQALAAAGAPDPPQNLRAEVTATLTAAMADPETAAAFAAGTLTKAAQWSGFGYGDLGTADDSASDRARSPADAGPAPVDIATRRSRRAHTAANSGSDSGAAPLASTDDQSRPSQPNAASRPIRLPRQATRLKRDRSDASSSADAHTARTSAQAAAQRATQEREQQRQAAEEQRQAAEEQRLAREAAERAAQAREKFERAERTLAQASAAAADAATVEDRLEAEVRDLEGRVTQAREDLAAARRRARHAEASERRARQTLDRLPRDEPRP